MKFVSLLVVTLFFLGCERETESSRVHEYMYAIRNEMYQSFYLPAFGPSAIPVLLTYRTDHKIIEHYPCNPISSFRGDSVTVAHIALWTIESIRTTWLKPEDNVYSRYPSLNPLLFDTAFVIGNSFELLDSVADRYAGWWSKDSLSAEERLLIDPLAQSTFRWR